MGQTERLTQVLAWRDRLATSPPPADTGLSPEGIAEGLIAALSALSTGDLHRALDEPGVPYATACVVVAGTVPTAAIEWCAVLLARGTRVTLKHPGEQGPFATWIAASAAAEGLPLVATADRAAIHGVELVVVMGGDDAIRAVRAEVAAHVVVLAHGHRFSAAWLTGEAVPDDPFVPAGFQDSVSALAADAALYDGRGCLSPVAVFVPPQRPDLWDGLIDAMIRAAHRWPLGDVAPSEAAAIRERGALARITGRAAAGPWGSLHRLPAARWAPVSLPRSLAVVEVPDAAAIAAVVAPWRHQLSTFGTDDRRAADTLIAAGASRVCRLGRMQRPPLHRAHDGEPWVRATLRAVSVEW